MISTTEAIANTNTAVNTRFKRGLEIAYKVIPRDKKMAESEPTKYAAASTTR